MRQDVIVIGAPRSGTNMLRNVLTELPDCGTWPCDEINYIWRHGNVRYPSDELRPEMATEPVRRYIRRHFDKIACEQRASTVVEKTCANSLRIDFVREVLPDAKFIVIRRDGVDAAASAMKRWTAQLDVRYLMRKARYVPPSDLPYYASRYLLNRLYRIGSKDRRLAFWGPRLDDMESLLSRYSLPEICAIQWKRCVDASDGALARLESSNYHEVAYEAFVRAPAAELRGIIDFLSLQVDQAMLEGAVSAVTDASVGAGRRSLADSVRESVSAVASDTLMRHGYA